ncbi:Uncharacterized protein Fot_40908 [Forsythia ovata]|uniref:Uncharacterized protein n=1 Tax=Forsythia ovata TaxID=205694 RepID=A0ABD1RHY1_9LAMI
MAGKTNSNWKQLMQPANNTWGGILVYSKSAEIVIANEPPGAKVSRFQHTAPAIEPTPLEGSKYHKEQSAFLPGVQPPPHAPPMASACGLHALSLQSSTRQPGSFISLPGFQQYHLRTLTPTG